MLEANVKKVIAWDGAREIVESSLEEMQNFIVWEDRPDFDDESILCIKFIVSYSDSLVNNENDEETCWYINPTYTKLIPECIEFEKATCDITVPVESWSLRMASEYLPELILISSYITKCNVFQEYDKFYRGLMARDATNLDDETKYELFMEHLQTIR